MRQAGVGRAPFKDTIPPGLLPPALLPDSSFSFRPIIRLILPWRSTLTVWSPLSSISNWYQAINISLWGWLHVQTRQLPESSKKMKLVSSPFLGPRGTPAGQCIAAPFIWSRSHHHASYKDLVTTLGLPKYSIIVSLSQVLSSSHICKVFFNMQGDTF